MQTGDFDVKQVASGVHCLRSGRGITEVNVYLVASGSGWVLIDAAWPGREGLIKSVAETLFGAGTRPAAIVLTHIHPDHSGSARELARMWDVPVYVHPAELPMAPGRYLPEYANPLDKWLVAPVLQLLPPERVEASQARTSLAGIARGLSPDDTVPGLPDWRCVPAPGHTPGHAAFFRSDDRVLVTGDAVLTINLNSALDWLSRTPRVSGPPYISTWDWQLAKESVARLARLEPLVLAPGHGRPMTGPQTSSDLQAFSARFAAPRSGQRPTAERARSRPEQHRQPGAA